jgi:hypothetical protein
MAGYWLFLYRKWLNVSNTVCNIKVCWLHLPKIQYTQIQCLMQSSDGQSDCWHKYTNTLQHNYLQGGKQSFFTKRQLLNWHGSSLLTEFQGWWKDETMVSKLHKVAAPTMTQQAIIWTCYFWPHYLNVKKIRSVIVKSYWLYDNTIQNYICSAKVSNSYCIRKQ